MKYSSLHTRNEEVNLLCQYWFRESLYTRERTTVDIFCYSNVYVCGEFARDSAFLSHREILAFPSHLDGKYSGLLPSTSFDQISRQGMKRFDTISISEITS